MDEAAVLLALLEAHLTDGLKEGLALDVAGGAADLSDDHISLGGGGQIVDVALDLVGDVGDDLDGLAEVSALTLLVQHVPVHLAGGQVRVLVQVLVDKAFVMAEVEVGLSAVVGDEDLAVLQGTHGARVHVHIGVQLLAGHLEAAALQQSAQRGGGDAFAQTGDDAAGHENKFCHSILLYLQMVLKHILSRCGGAVLQIYHCAGS